MNSQYYPTKNQIKERIKVNLENLKSDLFELEINVDAIKMSKDGLKEKLENLNTFDCLDENISRELKEFIEDIELYLSF